MELPILIGIAGFVLVVVVVTLGVRARRSRSERSDWLGELTEIRRSSLGDDEEVTGALEAVTVIEDDAGAVPPAVASRPGPVDPDVTRTDPAVGTGPGDQMDDKVRDAPSVPGADAGAGESPAGSDGPVEPAGSPRRSVSESDRVFDEYAWAGFATLRIDRTEPNGLRVMVEAAADPAAGPPRRAVVDLPHGSLWFRSDDTVGPQRCTVRTAAGWVAGRGDLLLLADDPEWVFVLCLDGEVTLIDRAPGERPVVPRGHIGRLSRGSGAWDIVDVGVDALGSDPAVRRHRRLDTAVAARPDPASEPPTHTPPTETERSST